MASSLRPLFHTLTRITLLLALATTTAAQAATPVAPTTWQSLLAEPNPTPAVGAAKGDVTIVEFFDYNCPGCRALDPQMNRLLSKDGGVRVIRRDWPVFGAVSAYAAYCSYAAAKEGKYQLAHDALINSKQDLDKKEDVQAILRAAGFDMQKIDADIAQHEKEYSGIVARDAREAQALGVKGTPGVVIGGQVVSGDADYARLVDLVAQARKH
jgi:protein-disulfide isomerase